jgi:hypothetical protein
MVGFIDQIELGTATPFYTPIDSSDGFWKIASTSATIGGKVVQRAGNTAIADTGTTLCLVDKALCKAIYAQIPGAKSASFKTLVDFVDMIVHLKDTSSPLRTLHPPFLL